MGFAGLTLAWGGMLPPQLAPPMPDPDRLLAALDAAPGFNEYVNWSIPVVVVAAAIVGLILAFGMAGWLGDRFSRIA